MDQPLLGGRGLSKKKESDKEKDGAWVSRRIRSAPTDFLKQVS